MGQNIIGSLIVVQNLWHNFQKNKYLGTKRNFLVIQMCQNNILVAWEVLILNELFCDLKGSRTIFSSLRGTKRIFLQMCQRQGFSSLRGTNRTFLQPKWVKNNFLEAWETLKEILCDKNQLNTIQWQITVKSQLMT